MKIVHKKPRVAKFVADSVAKSKMVWRQSHKTMLNTNLEHISNLIFCIWIWIRMNKDSNQQKIAFLHFLKFYANSHERKNQNHHKLFIFTDRKLLVHQRNMEWLIHDQYAIIQVVSVTNEELYHYVR